MVLRRCGGQSAQSGRVANLRQLRVVLRNPASGVSLDNAVLLTSKESYVLSCQRRRQQQRGQHCNALMTMRSNNKDNNHVAKDAGLA
jgi:hypothetical protein